MACYGFGAAAESHLDNTVYGLVTGGQLGRSVTIENLPTLRRRADGWGPDPAAHVTIRDPSGTTVGAWTLLYGSTATESVCLNNGCYTLEVSEDEYASEVSWSFGSLSGSAPFERTNFTAVDGIIVASCNCFAMAMFDDWGGAIAIVLI